MLEGRLRNRTQPVSELRRTHTEHICFGMYIPWYSFNIQIESFATPKNSRMTDPAIKPSLGRHDIAYNQRRRNVPLIPPPTQQCIRSGVLPFNSREVNRQSFISRRRCIFLGESKHGDQIICQECAGGE